MRRDLFGAVLLWCSTVVLGGQTLVDKPVATINLTRPEMISMLQLDRQYTQIEQIRLQSGGQGEPLTKLDVLELMISEILINQGMERDGIRVSQEELDQTVANQKASIERQNGVVLTDTQFRNAIEGQTGVKWSDYTQRISDQLGQQKYLVSQKPDVLAEGRTPPTSEEIKQFYRKNRSQFTNPEIVRYSHIVKTIDGKSGDEKNEVRRELDAAYRKLQNGSSFEDLVVEYSDDTTSRYSGGDAGYLAINDPRPQSLFGQDFMDSVFKMKAGEVSKVMESRVGYHIVKITEYYDARILELDDRVTPDTSTTVRGYIADLIAAQNQQQALESALDQLVDDLRKEAEVVVLKENVK